ncbi:MAG: TadE/TadG family type IV pilus assembly protein [Acidimicrobiia bacterium]
MKRARNLLKRIRQEDRGVSLPLVAGMFVVLLGMAAFAIDLGWLYLNGTRLQRAADSSALAGVVFLPADTANVAALATDGANANGWNIGTVNGTNVGAGPDELTWTPLSDNKLQIELETTIPTFFLKVLGMDQFTMSRTATAEYIKPVPLGSPANCIGIGQAVSNNGLPSNALNSFNSCNSYTQNFWGAINGRRTDKNHGDPYGVTCGYNCSGSNSDFTGSYYHAIEVPAGKNWVDLYIYDAGFYDRSSFGETGDEDDLSDSTTGGTHMNFRLFQPDSTPLIPEDNSAAVTCSSGTNNRTVNSESNSSTYKNTWVRMCRISNPTEGLYILRTTNSGDIGGSNSFSFLAATNNISPPARIYAVNSMSIFTNAPSGQATVYIAEVDPVHANKTLELRFYDPGEGSGNAYMTVEPPPGVSGHSCSWTATNYVTPNNATSGNGCSIHTTVSGTAQFNGEWITMEISIPPGYNCTTDCFWKMDLDLNTSHDRTTWEARIIGNPVKLVPNP